MALKRRTKLQWFLFFNHIDLKISQKWYNPKFNLDSVPPVVRCGVMHCFVFGKAGAEAIALWATACPSPCLPSHPSLPCPRAGPSQPGVVGAWHSALLGSSSCTLAGENQLWSEAGGLPGNWKGVIKNGIFQTTSDVLLAEGNRLLGIWTALGFGLNCKVGWDFRPPGSWGLRTQLKAY